MKHPRSLKAIVCAIVVGASSAIASAAPIAGSMHESFSDYGTATFSNVTPPSTSQNGGLGWNTSGTLAPNDTGASWGTQLNAGALRQVTEPGLTYAATGYLPGTGNKLTLDASSTNVTQNIGRSVGGQTIDSGTTYFSLLMSRNNETQRSMNIAFFNGTSERFSVGQTGTAAGNSGGNITMVMNNQNPAGLITPANPIAMGTGVTHLIIGRIDWNAGGNDTLSIWVDPTDVTTEAAAGTVYASSSGFELQAITAIRPFAGNTSGTFTNVSGNWDEIRLGGTWASVTSEAVTPEPGTCALMAAAVFGLTGARRRTSRR